jgi:D-alanyl-D-alanine dipeptidase
MLERISPGETIVLDLCYGTARNITGRPIYGNPACFLHPDAAAALHRAAGFARALDLRLQIYDAFRPSEAQWMLWRHLPDPMYIADPREGSNHSRGVAVDLTLADRQGGMLDMGTPFDDMTPASHHGSVAVSKTAQANRFMLLGLMRAAGFTHYAFEWWHYELPGAAHYPVLEDAVAGTGMMGPCA